MISGITLDDIKISIFYGIYNGCAVVKFDVNRMCYMDVMVEISIDDMRFIFGSTNIFLVWIKDLQTGKCLYPSNSLDPEKFKSVLKAGNGDYISDKGACHFNTAQ